MTVTRQPVAVQVKERMIYLQYACNLFSSLCNLFSLFKFKTAFIPQHVQIFQLITFLSSVVFSEVLIHFVYTIQCPFNFNFQVLFSVKCRNCNAFKAYTTQQSDLYLYFMKAFFLTCSLIFGSKTCHLQVSFDSVLLENYILQGASDFFLYILFLYALSQNKHLLSVMPKGTAQWELRGVKLASVDPL